MNKTDVFKSRVEGLVGSEYSVLGEYKGANIKLLMKHEVCGNKYEVTPSKFTNTGRRCPTCNGGVGYTHEEYEHKFYDVANEEYKLLNRYINQKIKVKVTHKECGYTWDVAPSNFLSGTRCPKCQHRSYVKTQEEFENEVFDLVGIEFEVLGTYKNNKTKIRIRHLSCGFEYRVTPYHFTQSGSRCPKCKESSMERIISDILNNGGIEHVAEKRFSDCRNKRPLPFDFYIPSINMCIEADGIQHFEPRWGMETFIQTQKNDVIKNQYCLDKGITLLRIPYYKKDKIKEMLINNKAIPSEA